MAFIDEEGRRAIRQPPLRRAVLRPRPHLRFGPPPTPGPTPAPVPGTPEYDALLKSDPEYAAWIASRQQREGDLVTNRAAQIRQLILQYGGLPPGFKDTFGDLRPEDLTAASGNPFSVSKVLQKRYEDAVSQMKGSLSARGALQSGELPYGQQQTDYANELAKYTSGNELFSSLNQALSGYTGGVGDIEGELPGIISSVMGRLYQNYKPTIPAVPPQPHPTRTTSTPNFAAGLIQRIVGQLHPARVQRRRY